MLGDRDTINIWTRGDLLYNPDKAYEEWDWDKGGGGTNHEMEHAIKCITQCMLELISKQIQ